ncbi:MAG: hypothetical protein KF751_07650 [Nitrospira sp.]|nr:hypothetical protein [Nitrospira sp.]MBX3348963.1 hypothetical protein [Nitrospira sp.]
MDTWVRIALVALLSVSMGCASLDGRAVPSGKLSKAEPAKGISYYLPKPTFAILRKGLSGGKRAVPQYELAIGSVADESKRFEVGMSQGLFTSDTFDLKMGPGQTVTSLNSKRTDEIGPTFASLIGVGAAILPMVAKFGALLLDVDDDELLLAQILGVDQAKIYGDDTKYLQGVITPGGSPTIDETKLDRWRASNAIIRKTLVGGRPAIGGNPEIVKIEALLEVVMKGYAYPKTPSITTSTEDESISAAKKIRQYEPVLTRIDDMEDEIGKVKKDTTKPIQRILASLQTKVHQELLSLINGTTTNKTAFNQALANLRAAIELIVESKDQHDRKLLLRKRVLTEFLDRPFPARVDEDKANVYQKLGDEVAKVVTTISALLDGDPQQTADPLPLGTDVTSRIDKKIFYMRAVEQGMDDFKLQKLQVPLAKTIMKYAGYEAVIVIN